jgi:hypothetical protein
VPEAVFLHAWVVFCFIKYRNKSISYRLKPEKAGVRDWDTLNQAAERRSTRLRLWCAYISYCSKSLGHRCDIDGHQTNETRQSQVETKKEEQKKYLPSSPCRKPTTRSSVARLTRMPDQQYRKAGPTTRRRFKLVNTHYTRRQRNDDHRCPSQTRQSLPSCLLHVSQPSMGD